MLSDQDIFRLLRDIWVVETGKRRSNGPQFLDLKLESDLSDATWGIDSIEFLDIAGIVNEMFQLHKTGIEDNLLRYRSLDRWVEIVSTSWKHEQSAITFRTSGSTGAPKTATHLIESLLQEVDELASAFEGRQRIISMVPSHHIYGFIFTILLPKVLNAPVIEGREFGASAFQSQLSSGDLIVSFPFNWVYLERSMGSWPKGVQGVTSTGPMPSDQHLRLLDSGIEVLTEIYGCSEQGGIGLRRLPDEPFQLFSYWKRKNSSEDMLIRSFNDGTEKEIVPEDTLEWYGENTFKPIKRRDGAVQVAGVNVYPDKIAETISQHEHVKECVVRLADELPIPRLKAFIIPEGEVANEVFNSLKVELENWMKPMFSASERPVYLKFGSSLPLNSMGKIIDWSIE